MTSARSAGSITSGRVLPQTRNEIEKGSLEELIFSVNGIIWEAQSVRGQKSHITFVSPNAEPLLGYSPGRWRQVPDFCEECLHPDDKERVLELRERAIREQNTFDCEYRVISPSGKIIWLRSVAMPYPDGPDLVKLRGLTVNITDRKESQKAIQQSEELVRVVLSSMRDHIAVLDLNGRIIIVNESWNRYAEENGVTSPSKVGVGVNYLEVLRGDHRESSEDAEKAIAGIRAVLDGTTKLYRQEYFSSHPSRPQWFLMSVTPLRRPEGGAVVSHIDITERKLAEQELREAETRNRAFLKSVPDLMFMMDRDGVYLDYHARDHDLLFVRPEQFLGKRMVDIMPPDLSYEFMRCFDLALQSEDPVVHEYSLTLPTGKRDFEARIASCNHDKFLCMVRDITDRKLTEQRLVESQKRYLLACTAGGVSVWDYDLRTGETYCDSSLAQVLGFSDEERMTNADWLEIIHPEDRDRVLAQGKQALSPANPIDSEGNSPVPETEYRVLHKDGTVRWFLNRATVMRTPTGKPYRVIGTVTDITSRKGAEEALGASKEALRKSNRKVKQLFGKQLLAQDEERKRISRELHDSVNQQVAAISISLSKLKRELPVQDLSIDTQITLIEERIGELSESIRHLSHRLHSTTIQHVGLVSALNSYCDDISRDEGIKVNFRTDGKIVPLPAEVSLCAYRITQESLRNVVKYSGAKFADVMLSFADDTLFLDVIDYGIGFDTQRARNGDGLGLISMEERARQLDGSVQITSSSGNGTKIAVRLPIGGQHERH